jgi:hypothetical protein
MEMGGPFDSLKFLDEMQSMKEIGHSFEIRHHLSFNEEELNVSSDFSKITRKRKRRKPDDPNHSTLKSSGKFEVKRKRKGAIRMLKSPFKIITKQWDAKSEKSKEVQTPPKQIENDSSKQADNEQTLTPQLKTEQTTKNEKQERNRVCARKCRLRKKLHLENIEKENKILRAEVIKYRKELNTYKTKEEAGLLGSLSINTIKSETVEKLKARTTANSKELLNNYMVISVTKFHR